MRATKQAAAPRGELPRCLAAPEREGIVMFIDATRYVLTPEDARALGRDLLFAAGVERKKMVKAQLKKRR